MFFHSDRQEGSNLFRAYVDRLPFSRSEVSRHLHRTHGLSPRKFSAIMADKATPPPALVALLWFESGPGIDAAAMHAHNGMMQARREADSLRRQIDAIKAECHALTVECAALRQASAAPVAANDRRFTFCP